MWEDLEKNPLTLMTKDQRPHDCFINLGSHDITSDEITPKHLHSWQIRLKVGYDYNIKATEIGLFRTDGSHLSITGNTPLFEEYTSFHGIFYEGRGKRYPPSNPYLSNSIGFQFFRLKVFFVKPFHVLLSRTSTY